MICIFGQSHFDRSHILCYRLMCSVISFYIRISMNERSISIIYMILDRTEPANGVIKNSVASSQERPWHLSSTHHLFNSATKIMPSSREVINIQVIFCKIELCVWISSWSMFCFIGWASWQSGTPLSRDVCIRTTSSWICCHDGCLWLGRWDFLGDASRGAWNRQVWSEWTLSLKTCQLIFCFSFNRTTLAQTLCNSNVCVDFSNCYHFSWYAVQAGVYFDEIASGGLTRFVPRSVQIDLETGVCNSVSCLVSWNPNCWLNSPQLRSRSLGPLFRPDTFLTAEPGAGNNWAKGCK